MTDKTPSDEIKWMQSDAAEGLLQPLATGPMYWNTRTIRLNHGVSDQLFNLVDFITRDSIVMVSACEVGSYPFMGPAGIAIYNVVPDAHPTAANFVGVKVNNTFNATLNVRFSFLWIK